MGRVGFWFLDVTSLLYIVMTLNFFISGHMLPLDLLPPIWVTSVCTGAVFSVLPASRRKAVEWTMNGAHELVRAVNLTPAFSARSRASNRCAPVNRWYRMNGGFPTIAVK